MDLLAPDDRICGAEHPDNIDPKAVAAAAAEWAKYTQDLDGCFVCGRGFPFPPIEIEPDVWVTKDHSRRPMKGYTGHYQVSYFRCCVPCAKALTLDAQGSN